MNTAEKHITPPWDREITRPTFSTDGTHRLNFLIEVSPKGYILFFTWRSPSGITEIITLEESREGESRLQCSQLLHDLAPKILKELFGIKSELPLNSFICHFFSALFTIIYINIS